MPSTAVLVLAAGRGTRMRSQLPKVLHAAGGRSMLASVLAAVGGAGIAPENVAVVAGFGIEAVRAAVAGQGVEVILQEPQLGTGHAVGCGRAWWEKHAQLVVVHGDMPLLSSATVAGLARRRAESGAAAVLATASPREPRAYGRILRDPRRPERVVGIVEQRQASVEQLAIRELNAGFYCFETRALAAALDQLGTDNPHGEYYLTDTVALLAAAGVVAYALEDERECLGVNDRAELAALDQELRRRKVAALLAAGVSVQLPDTVVVDAEVAVGEDTVIEAGVHLLGATRIGAGCRIRAYSVIESAQVDDGAIVGPFARLRQDAQIGAGAHIGNFVEVKKSRLGKGSKANHLAYLGDAVIGAG
ncbi:MAG: bifunctional UDP-N-acetylglucosamine diphosphorylase/glucosamine-1-phosphate N-acetyltransferase GlmU, partial [Terriglobales bacterium]